MDKELLRFHMSKNGDSTKELAIALGLHVTSLYKKINGETEFSCREMNTIAKRYKLRDELIIAIFFNDK